MIVRTSDLAAARGETVSVRIPHRDGSVVVKGILYDYQVGGLEPNGRFRLTRFCVERGGSRVEFCAGEVRDFDYKANTIHLK